MPHNEHVTLVIKHKVWRNKIDEYEIWLNKIMPVAERYPGHLGVNIIKPTDFSSQYSILLRFDNIDHLYIWQKSLDRQHYLAELATLIELPETMEIRPGAEFWFTPENPREYVVPKWKQYILSLFIIFPIVNIVNTILEYLFPGFIMTLPGNFLSNAIIVACVVYIFMPFATRVFDKWLVPYKQEIHHHE